MAYAGHVKGDSAVEGRHQIQLLLLSKEGSIPSYKSWSYLAQNEIAVEVGRRMFYTDCHGNSAS